MSAARSRRRGAGSITNYRTKAGVRWRWQLRAPIDPADPESGERQVGRAGYLTAEAADDALQDARRRMRDQVAVGRGAAPRFDDFSARWLDGLRLEASTVQGYRKIVRNHLAPYLGSLRVDQVTPTRIARHYRELSDRGRRDAGHEGEPLSANSVNKVHIVLGSILEAAVEDGLIVRNPARRRRVVQAPTGKEIRARRPEIVTWSASELHAFLGWNRDQFGDELYPLWRTIAYTGMRRSEALALRWGDIDFASRKIRIRRAADVTSRNVAKSTKTGAARVVDVDDDTITVLRGHRAGRGALSLDLARPDAYAFGNLAGEIRSPNEVGRRWSHRVRSAQTEIGIDALPRITLKGLRHTHATLLLELGEHPKVVQERLGHSNITTTMNIYSHVTPTMQRAAADRLASLIAGT